MSQIVDKRFFYINSGSTLTGTNSTFTAPIQLPAEGGYDRVTLVQANIPISYYLIQAGENTFTLVENGVSTSLTIVPGNYNANSFSLVVGALLTTNSPGGLTYTISYPINYLQNNTGLFTYSVNTLNTVSIVLGSNSLYEQFGFNRNSTNTFGSPSGGSQTLVSSNVIKFVPEDTVYVHSNIVNAEPDGDILQEIYFSNNIPFSNQSFLNPDPIGLSKKLTTGNIRNISIQLTNENNEPLYLNGLSASFTIMVYKDNAYYRKAEGFMKYQINQMNKV